MHHTMPKIHHESKPATRPGVIDILLYVLAGSSMTIISISFLLWLRF